MTAVRAIAERLAREPVMLVAACLGTAEAVWPEMSPAGKIAVGLWGALIQRAFSTSKRTVDGQIDAAQTAARDGALADVASLAKPAPVRKPAVRKRP